MVHVGVLRDGVTLNIWLNELTRKLRCPIEDELKTLPDEGLVVALGRISIGMEKSLLRRVAKLSRAGQCVTNAPIALH